jgi:hypothetical protein
VTNEVEIDCLSTNEVGFDQFLQTCRLYNDAEVVHYEESWKIHFVDHAIRMQNTDEVSVFFRLSILNPNAIQVHHKIV